MISVTHFASPGVPLDAPVTLNVLPVQRHRCDSVECIRSIALAIYIGLLMQLAYRVAVLSDFGDANSPAVPR